jgi:hypothetical protein
VRVAWTSMMDLLASGSEQSIEDVPTVADMVDTLR